MMLRAFAITLVATAGCDGVFKLVEVPPDAPMGVVDHDAIIDATADAPTDPSLVAWYQLDSIDGGQAIDSIGENHGTCGGTACPTVIQGVRGMALEFDGADDIIQIIATAELNTTAEFTVAAWVRRRTGGDNDACPVNKAYGVTYNTYQVCVTDAAVSYNTWDQEPHDQALPGISLNEWHHVAMRFDGTSKQLVIDGFAQPSATVKTVFDNRPITLGGDIDFGDVIAEWPGAIDDVRIYNRALTPVEIAGLAALR